MAPDNTFTPEETVRRVHCLENEKHPAAPADTFTQSQVVFGRVGTRELRADLFLPKTAPTQSRPAVVYVHGGGWQMGNASQFARHAARMAAHDFVGLCIDYCLSGETPFPAALEDCKCAVRYLRAHAAELHLDCRRIGAVGGSAGAHLSAMLATTAKRNDWDGCGGHVRYPSEIQAAVLFNGEFDLTTWWHFGKCNEFMIRFFKKTYEESPELYRLASPITHVDRNTPPCLLVHGENDEAVPIQQSVDFYNRILATGGRSELVRVPSVGHAWFNHDPHYESCLQIMMKFLIQNLAEQKNDRTGTDSRNIGQETSGSDPI